MFDLEIIKLILNLMRDPSPIGLLAGRQGKYFNIFIWAIDSCWILKSILLVNNIQVSSIASHICVQEAKGEDEFISWNHRDFMEVGLIPGDFAINNKNIP